MANRALGLRFYGVGDADSLPQAALGDPIRLVTFRDLAAIVAPAPYVRAAPTDADVQEFRRVIDAAAKAGPVIPAPPGAIFRSEDVLTRWMEVHYAKLHETLGAIEERADGKPPYEYVRMELGA